MPSFLSKVFGRKKDEKGSSSVRGRGYDGVSLLEGKFEVVSPVTSPTIGEFAETSSRPRHKDSSFRLPSVKSPGPSSPKPSNAKDEFPRLPLSLPHPREDVQTRDLGTVFESYSEAPFLSDGAVSDRGLTPLEALILIRICSQAIVARGLETLGLMHPHWHSASPETQQRLISLFVRSLSANTPQSSAGSSSFSLFESEIDYTLSPHDVAAVLRWGLRHLQLGPDGFGKEKTWYQTFAEAERKGRYPPQTYSETLIPLIPATHLELLDATLDLFSSLAAHSEENSTSASKLTKAFGFWLLTAQRDRERDDWANFYDGWQSSGRILEHVFLARIRNQALKTRMPTRLTGLVTRYPHVEGEKMEDDIFLHPQLSTRQFEALLVRVESDTSPQEYIHRHPLQLVKDALVAQVMSVDDNELISFWEKIQKSGNDESEVTPGGYPGISRIFADDTLRYLSLVPGNHPWKKSTSPTFNLKDVQDSAIFRRLASSPGPSESEGLNGNTNGHAKCNSDLASPSSAGTSTSPSDWFQFSSAGFTDTSASTLPLASTLFGQDVEKTNPPFRSKRSSKIRSRSPSRTRKSTERAASPPPPPVPDLPQQYSQKPIFKSTSISLVKIDEAFIDFWVDALLEPVSSNWPKFVLCKLKSDLPDLMVNVNNQKVEYIIIEYVKRSIVTSPQSTAVTPPTSSTPPITIPSTPIENNNLERTTSPTKSLPSSPRSFKSEKQRFFNLFSSSSSSPSSSSRTSGVYTSATTSRGKKHKEAVASVEGRGVSDFGEVGKEKEKRSSSIVKLRMPSPRARKSMDTPRRSGDWKGSANVDVPEQDRGRSMGEKKEMGKLKEVEAERKEGEIEKKENEEKVMKAAERKVVKEEEEKAENKEEEEKAENKVEEVVKEKKREVDEEKVEDGDKKEAEEKKVEGKQKKDSPSEIPSIATSAVAATAVAVAAVTASGSLQAASQKDADTTEDIRPVEPQAKEAVAEQELKEVITPLSKFAEQPARVLETVVESPITTEPTLVLTGQTSSTPSQPTENAKIDTAAEFSETGGAEDSAIQPSAPQKSEIGAAAKPIGKEEPVSENVVPEPVTVASEDSVLPQEEALAAQPVVVQAAPEPIETEEHIVVEEPAAFSPPGLEPQIAEGKSTQEPEAVDTVSEPAKESAPQSISAVSVAIPASHPSATELTPVAEESAEDVDAVTKESIATQASSVVSEPVAAEELLVIEGPVAFDPSDIDAQVEEMNAQVLEEIGDSEPASEEDPESLLDEECSPADGEVLPPIQEANEDERNLAEDVAKDIVKEPAVLEASVEETIVATSVPPAAEATAPSPVPETPVAEEKDEVVSAFEGEEQASEAAPVQEELADEAIAITEALEEPASPVVEPSLLAADESPADEDPTAAVENTTLEEFILEEVVEEPIPDAPTQEALSEPEVAIDPALEAEASTITNEVTVIEEVAPAVEEDHAVEDAMIEEDPATQVPACEELVSFESISDPAFLDEHDATEELIVDDDKEAAIPEQLIEGGASDEANSSDVVPDQPAVIEQTMEAPFEEEPAITQPAAAESAPVEHVVFEEPEVVEEPPVQEQADEYYPIEAIAEPSAEVPQAPAAETTVIDDEDVMEVVKAEEPAIVDQPPIKEHPAEPAKEPVAEVPPAEELPLLAEEPPMVVEEPPVVVEEPSTFLLAEAANAPDTLERPASPALLPVSEATVTETPILEDEVSPSVTQPVDTTPVIDEDAIDAAAAKPAEPAATPSTTAMVEEHEVTTTPDEPSARVFDNKTEASNGSAEHVLAPGVANGNGHRTIITEKESASKDDEPTLAQADEHTSNKLSDSVPVLIED